MTALAIALSATALLSVFLSIAAMGRAERAREAASALSAEIAGKIANLAARAESLTRGHLTLCTALERLSARTVKDREFFAGEFARVNGLQSAQTDAIERFGVAFSGLTRDLHGIADILGVPRSSGATPRAPRPRGTLSLVKTPPTEGTSA